MQTVTVVQAGTPVSSRIRAAAQGAGMLPTSAGLSTQAGGAAQNQAILHKYL